MNNIKLLDCTLRDGMYATDFVIDDMKKRPIISGLEASGVDIIECGFLNSAKTKPNSAKYSSPNDIIQYISPKHKGVMYIAIIANPNEMWIDEIPERTSDEMIDGIRIAFPPNSKKEGLLLGRQIKAKGYKVMLQAARTKDYTKDDLITLLKEINDVEPYWLGIVDTNGNTLPSEVVSLLKLYEQYLNEKVNIGFHFHNNMQLAFANTISALENISPGREYIIDTSIFGMGAGAGNLPTELAMNYLNRIFGYKFDENIIMDLFDKYLLDIYKEVPWGYTFENFITADINCQSYYGQYIYRNADISHNKLKELLGKIPEESRHNFKIQLADKLASEANNRNKVE